MRILKPLLLCYKTSIFTSLIFLFLSAQQNIVAQVTQTFVYTGAAESWVVPSGVTDITIEVWGAEGAQSIDRLMTNGEAGLGGYSMGSLTVNPGETLSINVGGQGNTDGSGGFNGGGNGGNGSPGSSCSGGFAGGGGGASDVRQGGVTLAERVIIAGGGGGGARDYCNGSCQPCGCGGGAGGGGGLTGVDGNAAFDCGFAYPGTDINFGMGATQAGGGMGGPPDGGGSNMGQNGVVGLGGDGTNGTQGVAGGGGGGGLYGGGGGGGASNGSGVGAGGGGGGSSFLSPSLANTQTLTSLRSGNGEIVISYMLPSVPTLGQWGLICLSLLVLIFGIVQLKQGRSVLSLKK